MIDNLLEAFEIAYKKHGDDFISDEHKLDLGLYIRVHPDQSVTSLVINKGDHDNRVDETYQWFQKRDFLSKYLESNKAVLTEPIKRVHSNNYLSWFVKKDTLMESDKTLNRQDIIKMSASYFDSLEGEALNKPVINDMLEGAFDQEKFQFCKTFLTDHFDQIENEVEANKAAFSNYVKVFFDFDLSIYQRESNRYFYHKIFNSDAYNLHYEEELYGLSNFNMGLNGKKPYLEHKTMKRKAPYMISLDKALLGYKYSLYLKNHGYGVRYQSSEKPLKGELKKDLENSIESQNLIYLSQDNGSAIIQDYDIIPSFTERDSYFTENHLEAMRKDPETQAIIFRAYTSAHKDSIYALEEDLDKYVFLGQLKRNYFTDGKSIKPSQFITKIQVELLLQSRQLLFDYFRKGIKENLSIFCDKYCLKLVLEALKKGKGVDAFNVYYSLKKHCKGEKSVNSIQTYKEELRTVLESTEDQYLKSHEAYSFAAGQLAYYLLSRSGASKKNHDIIEPFLNRRQVGQLNEELTYWFKRYAHDIGMNFRKFNRLYAAVLAYDKTANKHDDIFLAGYLSTNMLYEKKEVLGDE